MQQFNLNTWLQDRSRKVVTRDGKPVRIVCWDKLGDYPIIGCIKYSDDYEDFETYNIDGSKYSYNREDPNDLFFADEEEILTEFEKDLQIIISEASHWTSDDGSMSTYCQFGDKEIKKISVQILDLARRELQPEFDKEMDKMLAETDKVVYQKGREDALKSLPKWKKGTPPSATTLYVIRKGYYMPIDEVDKLFETLLREE